MLCARQGTTVTLTFSRHMQAGEDPHDPGSFTHPVNQPHIALTRSNVFCTVYNKTTELNLNPLTTTVAI